MVEIMSHNLSHCTNVDYQLTEYLFKHAILDYVVTSCVLHRTFKKKKKCYWAIDIIAKPGSPIVWSKACLKSMATYFTAMSPIGLYFEGIVETNKNVNGTVIEGATVFYTVYKCNCTHFFEVSTTKFDFNFKQHGASIIQQRSFKELLEEMHPDFDFYANSDIEDDGKNFYREVYRT